MGAQIKVGIFFVVGLVILLAVFDFVGDVPFFKNEIKVKTYFNSIAELKEGAVVKLEGFEIGRVRSVKIADRNIEVVMSIQKDGNVRADSEASIRLTSLLGASYINLTFGTPDSPLAKDGAVLKSVEPADINDIMVKVDSAVSSLDNALGGLDIFGDNKEQVSSIVKNLDLLLSGLEEGEGTLGKLFKDDTLYSDVTGAFANVNEITSSIKEGRGTLGKLLYDDSLYNDTKTALSNFGSLTEKLNTSNGTIGKLLNDDTLYNEATGAAYEAKPDT